jgi:hypothetical protein
MTSRIAYSRLGAKKGAAGTPLLVLRFLSNFCALIFILKKAKLSEMLD